MSNEDNNNFKSSTDIPSLSSNNPKSKTSKNNKKLLNVFIISLIVIINIAIVCTAGFFIHQFKENQQIQDYRELNMLTPTEIGLNIDLVYQENIINPPIIEDGEIYMPIDLIKEHIDEYIFWEEEERRVTITTEHNVIRMQTEELEYFINDKVLKLELPIYNLEGIAYMPTSFLQEFYQVVFIYNQNTLMLDLFNKDYQMGIVSKKLNVREEEDPESSIIDKLDKNSVVYFKELTGTTIINAKTKEETLDGFTQIETENGFIGYIETKYIQDVQNISIDKMYDYDYETRTTNLLNNGKLNVVFDQMQSVVANTSDSRRTPHAGMDVLIPTWFSFKDESGEIINIADRGYVDWAHSEGYQVWGLLTDNFNSKISHAVLSSSETREYVIKQLLAFVSIYNLDGINIDFESVPKADGDYFIQFLRELAPLLKQQNALLSVDTFVPKPWTAHYNREEVGKIADYIIVMGYDEHYSGSEYAGSVASLNWSREAIEATLAENVPKEKLILGIPFYARAWTETLDDNNRVSLSSSAYGMNSSYNFIIDKGGEFVYDEYTEQYYGEVIGGNKTYKIWLEDETSVTKRLNLVHEYDIAGVGVWKRNLEKDGIWELMESILKK
ncbi:MAG: glycosyl hydrolase family 18 protein [bacterium]